MKLTLRIWRQTSADHPGLRAISWRTSPRPLAAEALDQLNEELIALASAR